MESKYLAIYITFPFLILSTPVIANKTNIDKKIFDLDGIFELQGQAGVGFGNLGDSTLGVTTTETDKLTNSNTETVFAGSVGIGYVLPFACDNDCNAGSALKGLKAGVNFYGFSEMHFKGDVYEYEQPDLNDADYKLDVQSERLMFDLSAILFSWRHWSLNLLGGAGVAWNHAEYHDYDADDHSRLTLDAHTQTQFAWEVGGGIRYQATPRIGFSLDYLYADIGKAKTGHKVDETTIPRPYIDSGEFSLHTSTIFLGMQLAL